MSENIGFSNSCKYKKSYKSYLKLLQVRNKQNKILQVKNNESFKKQELEQGFQLYFNLPTITKTDFKNIQQLKKSNLNSTTYNCVQSAPNIKNKLELKTWNTKHKTEDNKLKTTNNNLPSFVINEIKNKCLNIFTDFKNTNVLLIIQIYSNWGNKNWVGLKKLKFTICNKNENKLILIPKFVKMFKTNNYLKNNNCQLEEFKFKNLFNNIHNQLLDKNMWVSKFDNLPMHLCCYFDVKNNLFDCKSLILDFWNYKNKLNVNFANCCVKNLSVKIIYKNKIETENIFDGIIEQSEHKQFIIKPLFQNKINKNNKVETKLPITINKTNLFFNYNMLKDQICLFNNNNNDIFLKINKINKQNKKFNNYFKNLNNMCNILKYIEYIFANNPNFLYNENEKLKTKLLQKIFNNSSFLNENMLNKNNMSIIKCNKNVNVFKSLNMDNIFIPILPCGTCLVIEILSNWGNKFYVGLTGIEIFTIDGKCISEHCEIYINSTDIHNIKVLLDGVNWTNNEKHMWSAPFKHYLININLPKWAEALAMIRVWNYNKSKMHASQGVRQLIMYLDNNPIFNGEIRKASDENYNFSEIILFCTDDHILNQIGQNDSIFLQESLNLNINLQNKLTYSTIKNNLVENN